jgi:hypothetical protein
MGLNASGGITDANSANDNLYNYNLFALGARGD